MHDWVLDAIQDAGITEPEGRDEHLSVDQFRRITQFMTEDRALSLLSSLTSAFVAPTFPPERPQAEDLVGDLVRRGLLAD